MIYACNFIVHGMVFQGEKSIKNFGSPTFRFDPSNLNFLAPELSKGLSINDVRRRGFVQCRQGIRFSDHFLVQNLRIFRNLWLPARTRGVEP